RLFEDNYEGVADCMPNEAVKQLGGRQAIVNIMRQGTAEMARDGVHFERAIIDPPSELTKSANRMFGILPQVTVMKVPAGHLHQRSYLLGVSSDDGRNWKFIDGVKLKRNMAEQLFPDLPPSLALPSVGRPELEAVDAAAAH